MKAITVKQPWASLIVHGIKDIENRTWACPKKYIGQRVLIHAGADKRGGWTLNHDQAGALCRSKSILYSTDFNNLPFGSIIGSVEIVNCVQNHPSVWAEKSMENKCPNCGREIKNHFKEDYFFCEHCDRKCVRGTDYDVPIYNWVLANPILFANPILAKGKLSFWEYNGVIEEGGAK